MIEYVMIKIHVVASKYKKKQVFKSINRIFTNNHHQRSYNEKILIRQNIAMPVSYGHCM